MDHQKTKPRVAFLGLGAMGSRMAARLLQDGYPLTIWNRTKATASDLVEASAKLAETPRAAAQGVQYVIVMVTDDDASREVWLGRDGAIHSLTEGMFAIDSTTATPGWIKELAAEISKTGASFIESPVVGSCPQAEAGQLICLVGGDQADLDRARPVLEAFSGKVTHMGKHGLGAVTKLAVNSLLATQICGIGENINFLRKAGVEDERWIELFSNLPMMSPPMIGAMKGMAAGNFAPLFALSLIEKDLRYFLSVAEDHKAAHPVGTTVHELLAKALKAGYGEENSTSVAKVFPDRK